MATLMTNLERRALLGDRQAQEECTRQGIVLACPKCFKPVTVRGPEDWQPTFRDPDSGGDSYEFDCKCGLAFSTYKYDFKDALSDWNARPGPPVGRCEEHAKEVKCDNCTNKDDPNRCSLAGQQKPITCLRSGYEPKESEENATD